MAKHTHTTSRRRLLAAAPAALALPCAAHAASAGSDPDAVLLGLCAEFEALEHEYIASLAKNDEEQDRADAICNAIYREQAPIVAAITACRPTTLAGFTALANLAMMVDPILVDFVPTHGCYGDRLLQVMLRGMVGRAAA